MLSLQLLVVPAILAEEDAAKKGAVSTRQPCYLKKIGQWLCVPPFQMVCLLRVMTLYGKKSNKLIAKIVQNSIIS